MLESIVGCSIVVVGAVVLFSTGFVFCEVDAQPASRMAKEKFLSKDVDIGVVLEVINHQLSYTKSKILQANASKAHVKYC